MEISPLVRLRVSDLGKDYDRRPVLRNLSFEVQAGEVLVVTGRNGIGKSTLLRILAGLSRPTRGGYELTRGGETLKGDSLRSAVGYVAPDLRPYEELTVLENLSMLARIRGLGRNGVDGDRLIRDVGLGAHVDSQAGTLSTGQRQRLRLILSTLGAPSLLLLDEPGSNLDQAGRQAVSRLVQEARSRGPVVIATNDPEETHLGDRRLELTPLD